MNRFFDAIESCYIVENIKIADYSLNSLISTEEELNILWQADNKEVVTNHTLACLRQQIFMEAAITFDYKHVAKYADKTKQVYCDLIELNQDIEEQPYNWFWDNQDVQYDKDEVLPYGYPTEWFAVLPEGVDLAVSFLDATEKHKIISTMIWDYLMSTLPITIEGINDK
jgi:hypothetical protein